MLTISKTKLAKLEKERQERVVSASVIAAGLLAMGVSNKQIIPIIELFGKVLEMRYYGKHYPALKTTPWYAQMNGSALSRYQDAVSQALAQANFQPQDWIQAGKAMQETIRRARRIHYPVRHLYVTRQNCG